MSIVKCRNASKVKILAIAAFLVAFDIVSARADVQEVFGNP